MKNVKNGQKSIGDFKNKALLTFLWELFLETNVERILRVYSAISMCAYESLKLLITLDHYALERIK